jgi:hypothetical protein
LVNKKELELSEKNILCKLREIRAEILDLNELLDKIRNGEGDIETYSDYIDSTKKSVNTLLNEVRNLLDGAKADLAKMPPPDLGDSETETLCIDDDSIRHIENMWEQITANPIIKNIKQVAIPDDETTTKDQLQFLKILDTRINELIFEIAWLTIPDRLNEWLRSARPGYYIPFHLVFEDELPSKDARIRLLNFLAASPKDIKGGIIDAANGIIYRYSLKRRDRILSVTALLAAVIVSLFIIWLPSKITIPLQNNTTQSQMLLNELGFDEIGVVGLFLAWIGIWAGIVTHVAIGGTKRAKKEGLPAIIALRDIDKLVDAKLGDYILKIGIALIGFYGFLFTNLNSTKEVVLNNLIMNTFLVGYSLDSIVEVFGKSIEEKASGQVDSLKKQLGFDEK